MLGRGRALEPDNRSVVCKHSPRGRIKSLEARGHAYHGQLHWAVGGEAVSVAAGQAETCHWPPSLTWARPTSLISPQTPSQRQAFPNRLCLLVQNPRLIFHHQLVLTSHTIFHHH
jgi:hypothetical protein